MPKTPSRHSLLLSALLVAPIPLAANSSDHDTDMVELGRALFNDVSLSAEGLHSCATCHPTTMGLEGHTTNNTYIGLDIVEDGAEGGRSTPTLWGAYHRTQWGWAGLPTIEQNIRGIIVNRMRGPEPSGEQLAALTAYIMSLPLPETPFVDEEGTPVADAPEDVQRGFELFYEAGCNSCHMQPGMESTAVYDVAGVEVKVPSLWAVQHTGPWFHDGRYDALEDAVRTMWVYQADRIGEPSTPTDEQLADLVAYLEAL